MLAVCVDKCSQHGIIFIKDYLYNVPAKNEVKLCWMFLLKHVFIDIIIFHLKKCILLTKSIRYDILANKKALLIG